MTIYKFKQLLSRAISSVFNLNKVIRARRDRYVFCYHRVISEQQAERDGAHDTMWITPKGLESHIRWMRSVGEIVSYSRIIDRTVSNDQPWFALTFDDGWKDNYENAFPILKNYKVPALIFLATDAVNRGTLFWTEDVTTKTKRLLNNGCAKQVRSALLGHSPDKILHDRPHTLATMSIMMNWIEALKLMSESQRWQQISNYYGLLRQHLAPLDGYIMSWDEAREMHKQGISFGSHGHRHIIFKGLPSEEIETELRVSRSLILDNLQVEADSFCFPNARYNGNEDAILAKCGYQYGFRIDNMSLRNCENLFYIPRFLVSETVWRNPAYFKLYLLETPLYRSKPYSRNTTVV